MNVDDSPVARRSVCAPKCHHVTLPKCIPSSYSYCTLHTLSSLCLGFASSQDPLIIPCLPTPHVILLPLFLPLHQRSFFGDCAGRVLSRSRYAWIPKSYLLIVTEGLNAIMSKRLVLAISRCSFQSSRNSLWKLCLTKHPRGVLLKRKTGGLKARMGVCSSGQCMLHSTDFFSLALF